MYVSTEPSWDVHNLVQYGREKPLSSRLPVGTNSSAIDASKHSSHQGM